MWPASSWDSLDEQARTHMPHGREAWSVMDRLRQRYPSSRRLIPTDGATWESIVALAFVAPPADALDLLDAGGGVLDVRSGERWDLFFPGYFRSSWSGDRDWSESVLRGEGNGYLPQENADVERPGRARPVGQDFLGDWYFNSNDFNFIRSEVERLSREEITYDGRPTLMVVRAVYGEAGEPRIDWESTASGPLSDQHHGVHTLSLSEVVHRISTDLERQTEDPDWGVSRVLSADARSKPSQRAAAVDLAIGVVGGTLAAWLSRMFGP